jgi:hypothetical protein
VNQAGAMNVCVCGDDSNLERPEPHWRLSWMMNERMQRVKFASVLGSLPATSPARW